MRRLVANIGGCIHVFDLKTRGMTTSVLIRCIDNSRRYLGRLSARSTFIRPGNQVQEQIRDLLRLFSLNILDQIDRPFFISRLASAINVDVPPEMARLEQEKILQKPRIIADYPHSRSPNKTPLGRPSSRRAGRFADVTGRGRARGVAPPTAGGGGGPARQNRPGAMTKLDRSVGSVLAGLRLRVAEGTLIFDRPAPIRRLATATLRGAYGHSLLTCAPEVARRWFKPGGNAPAAYVFQALHDRPHTDDGLHFRMICWDPEGALADTFPAAVAGLRGRPFGESGARIAVAVPRPVEELRFIPVDADLDGVVLHLVTPLLLKSGGRPLTADRLTLAAIAESVARRINQLSRQHGAGTTLDWEALAPLTDVCETRREIKWVAPRRRSSIQDASIALSGWVGRLEYARLPAPVADLIQAASALHVGRHAVEGCGHLVLEAGAAVS